MEKIIMRADLSKIMIGKYVTISDSVIIKPPIKKQNKEYNFVPVQIGSFVFIDKNTIIQAMKIGHYARIGKDCVIGQRVVIGDGAVILDGSIVTADAQIAPYSVYGGKPALYLG
jgi:dynactin-5